MKLRKPLPHPAKIGSTGYYRRTHAAARPKIGYRKAHELVSFLRLDWFASRGLRLRFAVFGAGLVKPIEEKDGRRAFWNLARSEPLVDCGLGKVELRRKIGATPFFEGE